VIIVVVGVFEARCDAGADLFELVFHPELMGHQARHLFADGGGEAGLGCGIHGVGRMGDRRR
jgi:hypothetical protein